MDYLNHKSMQALLKELASKKHLIMVTHLRSTIALANTLHGVRSPAGRILLHEILFCDE